MINDSSKEYCANNLAAMVISKLYEIFPNERKSKIISDFMMSKIYSQLYDYEMEYWKEGPDYILNIYLKEKNK